MYFLNIRKTQLYKMDACRGLLSLLVICACLSQGTTTASRYVALEGSSAELQCNVTEAVVTIYWKKGDSISTASTVASFENGNRVGSDGDRITMTPSHSLMIDNVRLSDDGQYFCEVMTISQVDEVILEAELVVAIPPREPYPEILLIEPSDLAPSTNASCDYIIAQGTSFQLACEAANFNPSIQLAWFIGNVAASGSDVELSSNSDGTLNAYGSLEVTMGDSKLDVSCEASGEWVPEGPQRSTAVVCSTPSQNGGKQGSTTVIIAVVIVLILLAALVGILFWMRSLIKDTMVRSNYTKTVSADDDTPSRTRMSNFCHICCAACCPCMARDDMAAVETRGQSRSATATSHTADERDKKPRAPSAALKAKIQQNRKKQEAKLTSSGRRAESEPADRHQEHSPMLEDGVHTSTPINDKPPGARPKTRPLDETPVVIRDPHQESHSGGRGEGAASGEAETGF